jgi:quinol monooxygenase YgiN
VLGALIEPTSQEEGCVNYDLHQGVDAPASSPSTENWVSGAHLDAHLAAPHLVDFANKMGDFLDKNGPSVNQVRRIA